MHTLMASFMVYFFLILLSGCASDYRDEWVPQDMLSKIDSSLTFEHIKESPESYNGTTLFLGGEVLRAKRMKDHTQLMILQLPLKASHEPVLDRMLSKGRFMAQKLDFLDPAIVPEGTRITIVGTVSGSQTEPLDEMEYTYPTITIGHLKIWPKAMEYRYPPYGYRAYGYDPFYWGPYYFGPYRRPYYW